MLRRSSGVSPHLVIERREGLVRRSTWGLWQGAGEENRSLLLPAGELMRVAALEAAKPHQLDKLADPAFYLGVIEVVDPVGDVAEDGLVGEERVVLEDLSDPP
jgi:hypothetical protein